MTKRPVRWESDNVFNPAAVVRNGKVFLLFRAEDDSGASIGGHTSRIGLAESSDGVHFVARPKPVLYPNEDGAKPYEWPGGCEDPRIVESPDVGYVLTYTGWDRKIARLEVATSWDLVHWTKHGPAFSGRSRDEWSKSGSILTRRLGDHLTAAKLRGRYWMYWGEGVIRTATSADLIHWQPVLDAQGNATPVISPRSGHFDSDLCEPGPPAVLTSRGILLIYNGKNKDDVDLPVGTYSAGQVLLDPADPKRPLARSEASFFKPETPYERTGQYGRERCSLKGWSISKADGSSITARPIPELGALSE